MTLELFIYNLLSTTIVIVVLASVVMAVTYFKNKKVLTERQQAFVTLHERIKPNTKVEFAGGLVGKLVKVGEEYCEVELSKDNVMTISRYSISKIIEK